MASSGPQTCGPCQGKGLATFKAGVWRENPISIQILGICSTLAVTGRLENAFVMGGALIFVTTMSNLFISLLRSFTPRGIRMIAEMAVIATFVILFDQFLKAFYWEMSKQLGPYVGLIITNCILMGRAEAFALQNPPLVSMVDGLANGLGYAAVLAIIGFIREELDTSRLDALTALERRVHDGEAPCCREILWAAFTPYYRLFTMPDYGRHALRFLARLQIDMSTEIQEILNRDTQQIARRFDALLAGALPDLPDEIRRLRYLYFWTLTVQMFAGSGFLGTTGFGDLRAGSDAEALRRRFDYLVGGMEGAVSSGSFTGN